MSTSESPRSADPADLLGDVVADRFRLSSVVSSGSNAHVFDAVDDTNGRTVTVKLVHPDATVSDTFLERFDETLAKVATLSHPNIAALYDWGTTAVAGSPQPFVVVEQLTGGSLRDMFDRARQLSPSQALAVGLDACRALDYAHKRGFVHTELNPSKLVFGDDRRLRITDFGLAQLLNEIAWREPESVATHTAWYASPEQGRAEEVDGKTDVYALCLTLHEAVTGTLPFRHDSTVASLSARTGRLMPVSADLGPLAAVLEHAGRPEPDERASAAEFGKELVQAASKLPRPEPLPLLSTGLFDTPAERLRSPDDPTGGVVRPDGDADAAASPAVASPMSTPGDDLVILPLDSDVVARPAPVAAPDPTPVEPSTAVDTLEHGAADGAPEPAVSDVEPVVTAELPVEQAAPPRRRRSVPWKVLLAVLVVAALAVLGVLATRLFTATPVYTVPALVELPEAEARNLIAANDWVVTIERERSDVVADVGRVVRTSPQEGQDLAEGEPFLIVVSAGPTLRELPESTGLALSAASTRLVERGLDVLDPIEEFDEDVPAGTVLRWSVPGDATLAAGSLVEPDTPVQLVASMGPAPRTIPSVVGLPVGEARTRLEALRLTLTEADQEFSDDIALGSIISQSLDEGTEVERGSDLSVVVSRGPDIVPFPDLNSAGNYEEVAVLLRDAGFVPNLVFGDAQGVVQSILIDGEPPVVGETYRRGTQVDIRAL